MAEERPFQPSARRLAEARKRGQVPVSRDLARAAALLATLLVLRLTGGEILRGLQAGFQLAFDAASGPDAQPVAVLRQVASASAPAVLILLLAALLAAVIAGFVQVGPLLAAGAVAPSASRIDPVAHLQRIFSEEGAYELLMLCAKAGAAAGIIFYTLREGAPGLAWLVERDPPALLRLAAGVSFDLCIRMAAAFTLLAAIDFFYQRYRHRRRLSMTREEYERERRETEGDPLVRSRRRWLSRQLAASAGATEAPGGAAESADAHPRPAEPAGPR